MTIQTTDKPKRQPHTEHRLSDRCETNVGGYDEHVRCDHMRGDHDNRGCRKCGCTRMTYSSCPGCR
jgi:hypothetical protein